MTQHPPGYYAVAAAVYDLAQAGDWRYDRAIFLLRALTALMVAATVPACCYIAARELTGRESVGKIAAFVPLLIPQLQFVSGAVTNDGATIAAASVIWALLLRITSSGPTRRRFLVLAIAVAVACWTKGTALTLLPSVPLAIAIAFHRARGGRIRSWGPPALAATAGTLGLAFVLGGWWWAVNILRYGRLQPAAYLVPPGTADTLDILQFLHVFLDRMRWSFFGDLGVLKAPAANSLTATLAVLFTVLCVAGLVSRRRVGDRLVMLLGAFAATGVLFTSAYRAHLESNHLPGLQGRYLFVLIVPLAVCFAAGLVRLAGLVRFRAPWLLAAVAIAGLGVTAQGILVGFRLYYVARDRSWGDAVDRFLGWAEWSPMVVAALTAALFLCGLVLAWTLGRDAQCLAAGDAPAGSTRASTETADPRPVTVA
jgi:hypothetical protein